MPRLFTAIELPESHRETLATLEMPLPGARWLDEDDLHITLAFVGDIENLGADAFADRLAGVTMPAFALTVTGLGAFGGNDPKALWAAIAPCPELDALARANRRAAKTAGLAIESRGFRPHVTLARFRYGRPEAVAKFIERRGHFRLPPFLVSRFVLLSARPQSGGGPYVVEADYPLRLPASTTLRDAAVS